MVVISSVEVYLQIRDQGKHLIGPSLGAFCLHLSSICNEVAVHVFLIFFLNKKRKVVCQELLSCF